MLAALRPQMLRLAGREADGAILNWLASYDVTQCLEAIGTTTDTVARIFVCPTEDAEYARNLGRLLISTYLTVPAYAAFHDWLGRGDVLRPMHEAWAAGDRKGAAAAIPEQVVDDLVLHGSPESVRDQVQAYADAGVMTPVIALLPTPNADVTDIVRRLGRPHGAS
jgi:alkanesulfonate monooxygenase SsuD/methylene tetrahydromethanopterin reductase-like flavin-dependent oxidoreductase (luciferase family)